MTDTIEEVHRTLINQFIEKREHQERVLFAKQRLTLLKFTDNKRELFLDYHTDDRRLICWWIEGIDYDVKLENNKYIATIKSI